MNIQQATFGGGCFWCTEAVFQTLNGVQKVVSGYMGGETQNPTYMEICNGDTGHAEVIRIDFDADVISFEELLLVFFTTHNPTTLNRQGNDMGTQYRSVIFYHTEEQRNEAEAMVRKLEAERVFDKKIVTEISPASEFYPAEDYHQNYFVQNTGKPYCAFVIQPKMNKLLADFREKIKPELLP
ncbi:MAG: peptide-methionine (S)-S-oxide reductase [Sphingobacteriaceae bacterium]|jgi:peptide-methionine (S)-S-oxide reductase|nr:peptide-methionine (S)-S-oxide reductase [Sphingobacteriaceae bacterium]